MNAPGSGVNVGAVVGYAALVAGIALTLVQLWRERRRARPVVITNEVEKRLIWMGHKHMATTERHADYAPRESEGEWITAAFAGATGSCPQADHVVG